MKETRDTKSQSLVSDLQTLHVYICNNHRKCACDALVGFAVLMPLFVVNRVSLFTVNNQNHQGQIISRLGDLAKDRQTDRYCLLCISTVGLKQKLGSERFNKCQLSFSWNMYRLLVVATAMMLSRGCQAVWRIFLLKSRLSTLISSFLRFPPVLTLRGFRTDRGLLFSREASRVTS